MNKKLFLILFLTAMLGIFTMAFGVEVFVDATNATIDAGVTQTYSVYVAHVSNLQGFDIAIKFPKADFATAPTNLLIGPLFQPPFQLFFDNSDGTHWIYEIPCTKLGGPSVTTVGDVPALLFSYDATSTAGWSNQPAGCYVEVVPAAQPLSDPDGMPITLDSTANKQIFIGEEPGSDIYVANGQYSFTIYAPNSIDGAKASIWGYYAKTGGGWANSTYGTGTFTGGYATVNYTVPADYSSDLYWEVIAQQGGNETRTTLWNSDGPWGQFDTYMLDGQTLYLETYRFDDFTYSTTDATYKMVGAGGVIPAAVDDATVEVLTPWSGSIEDYDNSVYNNTTLYNKKGFYPTYATDRGYTVTVVAQHPDSPNFQEVRITKEDIGYDVTLFGFYMPTTADPTGYMWNFTFYIEPVSEMVMTYDPLTGICNGTFATPLSYGVQYFIKPTALIDVIDSGSDDMWYYYSLGGSMDLILGGTTLEEEFVPVVLSSFTAVFNSTTDAVCLTWVTQSESNLSGYYIYRGGENSELQNAVRINTLITGTNTSTQQEYIYNDSEITPSTTYSYWLMSVDMDGQLQTFGPISVQVPSDNPGTPGVPIALTTGLTNAFPNPFESALNVNYSLKKAGQVEIVVSNVKGQIVRTLVSDNKSEGVHNYLWDSKDNNGKACSSGIYFIRMTCENKTYSQKVILSK